MRHAMHVSILVCYTSGDLVELASIDACLTRRTWNSRVSYDVILTPHESTHVPRVAARVRVLHLCLGVETARGRPSFWDPATD